MAGYSSVNLKIYILSVGNNWYRQCTQRISWLNKTIDFLFSPIYKRDHVQILNILVHVHKSCMTVRLRRDFFCHCLQGLYPQWLRSFYGHVQVPYSAISLSKYFLTLRGASRTYLSFKGFFASRKSLYVNSYMIEMKRNVPFQKIHRAFKTITSDTYILCLIQSFSAYKSVWIFIWKYKSWVKSRFLTIESNAMSHKCPLILQYFNSLLTLGTIVSSPLEVFN